MRVVSLSVCMSLAIMPAWPADGGGLHATLNSMFDSNATGPGVYSTQNRTGFAMGSFVARAPVESINLVAFDPPRVNGGCGGIDLYGGAFSFINADQLVKLFRAIVANAISALFWMAIRAVTPSLGDVMSKFQALVTSLNMNMKNTCAIGTKIASSINNPDAMMSANALWNSITEPIVGATKDFVASMDDAFANFGKPRSRAEADPTLNTPAAKKVESPHYGNMTWRALVQSRAHMKMVIPSPNSSDNSVSNDAEYFLMRVFMSILGTSILREGNVTAPNREPSTNNPSAYSTPATPDVQGTSKAGAVGEPFRQPTITNVREFIDGPEDGKTISLYECVNTTSINTFISDENACMQIFEKPVTKAEWGGVRGKVNEAILGDTTHVGIVDMLKSCGTGNIAALRANATASPSNNPCNFTGEQISVINRTSVPLLYLLQRSQGNDAIMRSIASRLAPLVADDFARNLYQAIDHTAHAVYSGATKLAMPDEVAASLKALRSERALAETRFNERKSQINEEIVFIQHALRSIPDAGN